MGNRLQNIITESLATLIGRIDSNTLHTPCWKSGSMEHQCILVLHLRQHQWHLITNIHKHGVCSLYTQMSKGSSCDSLQDSNNLFHLHSYHWVFMSLLAYRNSQNNVYKQLQLHCAVINHDARPTIIDTLLTHIFKMGWEHFAICFSYTDGQYILNDCLQPIASEISQDTQPTIVNTPMMIILEWGREFVLVWFNHFGGQCIKKRLQQTNINNLWLIVAYLSATING